MRKNKLFLLVLVVISFFSTSCSKNEVTDAEKFSEEYTQVDEDNLFVYRTSSEIIDILKHGTGIVYLGFPECPWCQAYVPLLNEVAEIKGMSKINYYNIYDDRNDNTEVYQELVSILSDYLQYDDDGEKRIYVPAVIVILDGEIVGFDDETAYDTKGYSEPGEYWQDDVIIALQNRLSTMLDLIVDSSTCSDCNK